MHTLTRLTRTSEGLFLLLPSPSGRSLDILEHEDSRLLRGDLLVVYWSGASTIAFFQVSSGLNEVMCSAISDVCGPRSFWNTVPS
jgi:hypothetical protein